MTRHYEVYSGKTTHCNKCGAEIGFFKSKKGKWYPVDIEHHNGEKMYRTGMGNYNNYTPWHVCNPDMLAWIERQDLESEMPIIDIPKMNDINDVYQCLLKGDYDNRPQILYAFGFNRKEWIIR